MGRCGVRRRIYEVDGTMAKARREAIVEALRVSDQSTSAAARRLQIGRSTIYRLMAAYGIDRK
jgi:transcriptional regulator of acetoin/glycerol metabolism